MSHSRGIRTCGSIPHVHKTDRTLIFKASPREKTELDYETAVCGMLKQEYCIKRALGQEITVSRIPLVIRRMREECREIIQALDTISRPEEFPEELKDKIEFIMKIYNGLKVD